MINAKVNITGLDKALSQLRAYDRKLHDLSTPLKDAGEYLLEFFSKDVYQSEGSAIGSPWLPLTEPYQTQKFKKWGAVPILIASGKMSQSYSLKTASDYFIISNDAKNIDGQYYAGYHQEGTSKMVARPIMKFQTQQLRHVSQIIVDYINRVIRSL